MNDIQKMFQTIINNQSAFRQEMLKQFKQLETGLTKKIDQVAEDVKILTKRVDKLGMNQA